MHWETNSSWISEFQKQLVRGKHVLLYGNIADQYLFQGGYCSLAGFFDAYLAGLGYSIVTTYDIVDGFRFTRDEMQSDFERIVRSLNVASQAVNQRAAPSADGRGPSPASSMATSRSTGFERKLDSSQPESPPPRGAPVAGGNKSMPQTVTATPTRPMESRERPPVPVGSNFLQGLKDPPQALSAIRGVIKQSNVATAAILLFTDKLVTSPDHQDTHDRGTLIQLMKILQEAAYLPSGVLAGRKNLVVIVASQLGAVPEWLHKDNPFLELVKVPRPSQGERMVFVREFKDNFHEGATVTAGEVEPIIEDFANLTDGLSAWDLEAIRRTSVAEQMSLRRPRELVDFYKYGISKEDDPWAKLSPQRVRTAREVLEKRVIGQPNALRAIESMLMSARIGISMTAPSPVGGRPKGVFFFVGPTGVGKTELAKALTELIFSNETAFARFDMSEYAEKHAAEKLAGSPPGFVGYEEGGLLTNRVREKPFSLLLFDEIEKAHGGVMDKFLQILEDGRLTDGKGQTAYFSHSLIIFTSNIGSDTLKASITGRDELASYETVQAHYKNAVADHFTRHLGRPELLNRFGDNILVFDILRPEFVPGILRKFMGMLATSVRNRLGVELEIPDSSLENMIVNQMRVGDNLLYGGRRIKTMLEELVERPLNRWLFLHESPGNRLVLTAIPETRLVQINGKPVE